MGTDAKTHSQTLGRTQENSEEDREEGLWEQEGPRTPGEHGLQNQLSRSHRGSQRLNRDFFFFLLALGILSLLVGCPIQPLYEGLCLVLLHLVMSYLVKIPERSALC